MKAAELLSAFVSHAKSAAGVEQQNYTFLILHRDLNYIHDKLTSDHSYQSEQIFIGGLSYIRRLQRDGKPLTGRDLRSENELYEKAVSERTGLTDATRYALENKKTISFSGVTPEELLSDFQPKILGRQTLDGRECILLELTPLSPDAAPSLKRQIRYTLEISTLNAMASRIELLADYNHFSKGTVTETRSTYVNGVLHLEHTSIDTTVQVNFTFRKNVSVHIVGTDDYSNYRRFRANVTLLPLGTTSADSSPEP